MSLTLSDICARLDTQFFDASNLIVPSAAQEEAVRLALARINQHLSTAYTIDDLDSATVTTLPETCLLALLSGAGSYCLDFVLRDLSADVTNSVLPADTVRAWSSKLSAQFKEDLKQLRLATFHEAPTYTFNGWTIPTIYNWEEDQT